MGTVLLYRITDMKENMFLVLGIIGFFKFYRIMNITAVLNEIKTAVFLIPSYNNYLHYYYV